MNLTVKETYYKNYSYLRRYASTVSTIKTDRNSKLYETYKNHTFWLGDEFFSRVSEGACAALNSILNRTGKLDLIDYSCGNTWSDKKLLSKLRNYSYLSYTFNLND